MGHLEVYGRTTQKSGSLRQFSPLAGGWDMNDPSWPDVVPAGMRQFKPRSDGPVADGQMDRWTWALGTGHMSHLEIL